VSKKIKVVTAKAVLICNAKLFCEKFGQKRAPTLVEMVYHNIPPPPRWRYQPADDYGLRPVSLDLYTCAAIRFQPADDYGLQCLLQKLASLWQL
jgi:hypothetical protein